MVAAGILAAAAGTCMAEESGFPVTYSQTLDGNDYDFSIEQAPTKAVSMSQATTEMMLALGLADKMAGTAFLEEDIYEPLADEYAKVPVLAEKWPSYEDFMAADPDFVTGWAVPFTLYPEGDSRSRYRKAGHSDLCSGIHALYRRNSGYPVR